MTKKVSEKQLKANRENSKKWWVKTLEGKEKSKMNALKYWVYSSMLFNEVESCAYKTIIEQFVEEFSPEWLSEESLICQMALYEVKLHRVLYMEEYFNSVATFDNVLTANAYYPRREDGDESNSMYQFFIDASEILKVRNLDQIESMQKYREMLENRKSKCLNELMKIKFFKKNITS